MLLAVRMRSECEDVPQSWRCSRKQARETRRARKEIRRVRDEELRAMVLQQRAEKFDKRLASWIA